MQMNQNKDLHELIQEHSVLLGCCIDSASPGIAELAGMLGFHFVWGDLEHLSVDLALAENFCRGADAGGALPMLRIAGANREHVLHALEAGARIVVVPMVESAATAKTIVQHGKYAPEGMRGVNGSSRGLRYGIGDKLRTMQWANEQTHLFVQIETVEGARRCSEIVATEGISGGLVGPADLSVTMGKPLAFEDPEVIALFRQSIRAIRREGKIAAAVAAHPVLLEVGLEEGLQVVVCAWETGGLRTIWERTLRDVGKQVRSYAAQRTEATVG
jgi:4-hydroxy-2-oxoheptanedioate aldolase